MIIKLIFTRLLLCFCIFDFAHATEISSASFTLEFADDGRPTSCRIHSDKSELLETGRAGQGFHLMSMDGKDTPLSQLAFQTDGRLLAASADNGIKIFLRVHSAERHIALRIDQVEGLDATGGASLHFELFGSKRLRVLPMDYMTEAENSNGRSTVTWTEISRSAGKNPLGSFALYETTDEEDEDRTLMNIWVEEKLPHPKIKGEWTLSRAQNWVRDWQSQFADRTQLMLGAENAEDLAKGLEFAGRTGMKQIYLFTDVWRPEPFWSNKCLNWEVNTKIFPRGEADLRRFSDEVKAKGMYLALHYISGGIGPRDPLYIGQKPDRRLAGWGDLLLIQTTGDKDETILVKPALGTINPAKRVRALPSYIHPNWVRIGDEIIRFETIEDQADGTWLLKKCQRGQGSTTAAAHQTGEQSAGLYSAYGQNFIPANDSTLLDEIASNYAGLLNRCGVDHAEFDGAEIHAFDGFWGYRKFATRVYEALDHPTTVHDSRGSRPTAWFEYRLNSSRRLMAGSCSYTHGNYSVPVTLATPSRPATTLLDAHFMLSQGNQGGALGISKPEPMFGVTPQTLETHGLTDQFVEALMTWQDLSISLSERQRSQLNSWFSRPTSERSRFNHHLESSVVPFARKVDDYYEITPTRVLTRKFGDVKWQNGQEHGAISPRQFIKPNQDLTLENPDSEQALQFILHVLPALDPNIGKMGASTTNSASSEKTDTEVFTSGNDPIPGKKNLQAARNISLMPSKAEHLNNGSSTDIALQEGAILVSKKNDVNESMTNISDHPWWGVDLDLTSHRGIGAWVTGDGSGALLLIQIRDRDYVVPIDFTGKRYIEIPHGEVSWADGAWGWRMGTKSNDYSNVRQVKIGFGRMPPNSTASVKIEVLLALAETETALENPVINTEIGSLTVHGKVPSGGFLQYLGGQTAELFDENWRPLGELVVVPNKALVPHGAAEISVRTRQEGILPWLDVQFITQGTPFIVTPEGNSLRVVP